MNKDAKNQATPSRSRIGPKNLLIRPIDHLQLYTLMKLKRYPIQPNAYGLRYTCTMHNMASTASQKGQERYSRGFSATHQHDQHFRWKRRNPAWTNPRHTPPDCHGIPRAVALVIHCFGVCTPHYVQNPTRRLVRRNGHGRARPSQCV